MKKKVFITGVVHEYDSSKPEEFTDAIADFIKENMVEEKDRDIISVKVREVLPDQLVIMFPFIAETEISAGYISHTYYRVLLGECSNFRAKYSLPGAPNLGRYVKVDCRDSVKDVKWAYKKNTEFYGADKYRRLELIESVYGLEVRIFY